MFPNVPKKQKLSVFNLEPFKRPLNTLDRKRRVYFNKTTPLNEESKWDMRTCIYTQNSRRHLFLKY